MGENEANRLREKVEAKKERLHELELKEARYGLDVPPHISLEIKDLRGEIAALQTQLAALEKEQEAVSRLDEARRHEEAEPVPAPAKPRRPVNWERVGGIAGVVAVLIALGAWLVPNVSDFLLIRLRPRECPQPTRRPHLRLPFRSRSASSPLSRRWSSSPLASFSWAAISAWTKTHRTASSPNTSCICPATTWPRRR